MNLAKKLTAIFLVIAMILCFAACSNEEAEAMLDIGTINIGFIATGDVDEDAYSALQYEQFKSAYKLAGAGDGQVTIEKDVTAGDAKKMETAIADLIARGCRLIVGVDPSYANEFAKYAAENSNIFFVCPGDVAKEGSVKDNLAILNIGKYEAEYLAGIAAGLSTESGKIAYVADMTYGTVFNADINAFAEGAKSVKSDAKIFLTSTEDVKAGIDKATEKGCDVVYSTNYVKDEETGEKFFTVPESMASAMTVNKIGKDGNEFVTGTAYNFDYLYTKIVLNTVNESFADLAKYTWGIKDGVFDVFPSTDEKVKSAVDAQKDKFLKGDSIKVDSEKLASNVTVL
ncbi:MAG: BMP family ABC transporter substrate-binding protein [Clostridia bacterium]|nr:BMP family ABC transporter substrate-binding protein [Clostridia bacterium]